MNAMLPMNALPLHLSLQPYMKAGAQMTGDTRVLKAGDVMLAYPMGNQRLKSDNRAYMLQALSLGAALVLYEPQGLEDILNKNDLQLVKDDERCIPVEGLSDQAGVLSDAWYQHPSRSMKVIGITGTNGKTTVSQWIAEALQTKKEVTAVIGTLGAGILGSVKKTGFTTPDAPQTHALLKNLLMQGASTVTVEVSSHALEQGRVNGVEFDTVVITNLSQDHLDYHGSMEEYAAAKKKILHLPNVKNIIVNADDDFGQACLRELSQTIESGLTVWAYATQPEKLLSLPCYAKGQIKKVLAQNIRLSHQGMAFDILMDGEHLEKIQTKFVGNFNVSNALAVTAALLIRGFSKAELQLAIQELTPVIGRMELVQGKASQSPMAIVDFAHTPDALEQALKTLSNLAKERSGSLWCVFGCGGDRDKGKRPLMGRIAERNADHVMLTSDNPRSEDPEIIISDILAGFEQPEKAHHNTDRATAILQVIRQAQPEDVVLVAGKGHEDTQEIAGKRHSFSDQLHLQLAMGGAAI